MIRDSSDPQQSRSSLGGVYKTFEIEAGHLVNQFNFHVLRSPWAPSVNDYAHALAPERFLFYGSDFLFFF